MRIFHELVLVSLRLDVEGLPRFVTRRPFTNTEPVPLPSRHFAALQDSLSRKLLQDAHGGRLK
jgi:hypothetical protein